MKFPCFARDIVQTRRMFDWVFREDEKKKKRRKNIFGEYLVEGKGGKKNNRAGCSTATFLVIFCSTATYLFIYLFYIYLFIPTLVFVFFFLYFILFFFLCEIGRSHV